MKPLRGVLLDAGGTLFVERRPRSQIYADVARRHGVVVDEAAVARAMAQVHAQLPDRVDGGFRYTRPWFERFIVLVFARAGAPALPPSIARDLFATFADPATFHVFEDVVPTLERIRARGWKLAVVSNWSPTLAPLLERLDLARRFDAIVSSGQEEVEKPAAEIFTRALRRLGVAAAEAIHVGDHAQKDLLGARTAGLRAALLDRSGADPTAWTTLAPLAHVDE